MSRPFLLATTLSLSAAILATTARSQDAPASSIHAFRDKHAVEWARWKPELYQRPFGARAPWNVPVKMLLPAAKQEPWCEQLWEKSTADRPGNFNLSFDEYTYPIYRLTPGLVQFPVRAKWRCNLAGTVLPWRPDWKPAAGSDGQVILLDPASGREWDLFQADFDGNTVRITNGNLVTGDYRTKEDGFQPSRGCGIPYLAMLVVPEEIMQGAILHALSMPIRRPHESAVVPPATKTDGPKGSTDGIPEGMRFALRVSDDEIERWVIALPRDLPEVTRYAARVIAIALRDYGWIITDASGGAHLQFESRSSAAEKWAAVGLGITSIEGREFPRDLLDGLLLKERIYVVQPSNEYPAEWRPAVTPGIR